MVGWAILAANVGSTLFMTGLIWFVQIVHYPLMGTVPQGEFRRYALAHQRQTTWVVAPLMLTEAVSGFLLILIRNVCALYCKV